MTKVTEGKISDLTLDTRNANIGTERGLAMLETSLRKRGAGRSVLLDRHGRAIAGNKTIEKAIDIGFEDVIIVKTDGTKLVAVQREDLDLDDPATGARDMAYLDNRVSEIDLAWDPSVILADLETGLDLSGLWDKGELDALLVEINENRARENTIGQNGRLYRGHDIEVFKLAYRIEAAYKAMNGIALDLYSGDGQLANWYQRRFKRVIRIDKRSGLENIDYPITAEKFIKQHLVSQYFDFSFVDFDDEGSPALAIQSFFETIKDHKKQPFVLCLTDGNGLNLKCRGRFDFVQNYLIEGETKRKATQKDYENFEVMVTEFVKNCALKANFFPSQISSYRGREGNVVYQTWFIDVAENPANSENQPAGRLASPF